MVSLSTTLSRLKYFESSWMNNLEIWRHWCSLTVPLTILPAYIMLNSLIQKAVCSQRFFDGNHPLEYSAEKPVTNDIKPSVCCLCSSLPTDEHSSHPMLCFTTPCKYPSAHCSSAVQFSVTVRPLVSRLSGSGCVRISAHFPPAVWSAAWRGSSTVQVCYSLMGICSQCLGAPHSAGDQLQCHSFP